MNRVTELLETLAGVITNVRNLADSLQSVTDALEGFKSADSTEAEPVEHPENVYTLEDVRGILAEKSQTGLTAEVKGLLVKYGGNKLSDITPDKYAAIIKEAEVLGNE